MKWVVACLVLAVAVAGCGGDEPGWQDELRGQLRYQFNNPEPGIDPADYLAACITIESATDEEMEELRMGIISEFNAVFNDVESYTGTGDFRPIDEILAEYGVERTPAISGEVVDVYFDEFEQLCS